MQDLTQFLTLGDIALVPIIVALIEVFKQLGMPSKYAIWANIILSTIGAALIFVTSAFPTTLTPITSVLSILAILLSSTGFYHVVLKPVKSQLSRLSADR